MDAARWPTGWPTPGLAPAEIDRLAADPPLTLFLMLEAEADTGGRTLGALGSVIMGETLAAALPAVEADRELDVARAVVFRDGTPGSDGRDDPLPAEPLPVRRRRPPAPVRRRRPDRPRHVPIPRR